MSPIYVNALFVGYIGTPLFNPYPSRYKYPSLIPVFPPDLTNINKSPPRMSTILPISSLLTPRFLSFALEATPVNAVPSPFKKSLSVSKNPTTRNPCPAGPVEPVSPVGPGEPVIPLPVEPVAP
jgi:hypothetical protein